MYKEVQHYAYLVFLYCFQKLLQLKFGLHNNGKPHVQRTDTNYQQSIGMKERYHSQCTFLLAPSLDSREKRVPSEILARIDTYTESTFNMEYLDLDLVWYC